MAPSRLSAAPATPGQIRDPWEFEKLSASVQMLGFVVFVGWNGMHSLSTSLPRSLAIAASC